jgi:hypothetical protein
VAQQKSFSAEDDHVKEALGYPTPRGPP